MLQSLRLSGYRSLRDLRLRLGRVTVIRGANGVGKTNIYRALRLLSALARGDFTESVAAEGGMRSLLWAGNTEHPRLTTFSAEVISAAFTYEFECGLRPAAPGDLTAFKLDPDIKLEALRNGKKLLAKRTSCQVRLADSKGTMHTLAEPIGSSESMLALIRDLENYPSLLHARLSIERWRFYHSMRTDPDAPARRPVRGCWSPVLAEDASNLPSVIQTINESNQGRAFHTALQQAFPGSRLMVECDDWFHLAWQAHDLPRTLAGHELSDGTLQFICLAAVLCSPRPPPLLVLNEPETSLNESVFPALAELILKASEHSQILIISHSQSLCAALATLCKVRIQELTMRHGDTRLLGQEHAKACYIFEDDDENDAEQDSLLT